MSDPPMLRIGPFSRAASLSIKALRFYHETGLLVPAVVDPDTGYRSYSPAQLIDAAVIRRLRDMDVPIESIREVLTARDPAVTQKVLAEHAAALETRVDALRRAVDDLYAAVDAPALHTGVFRRRDPARTVLAFAGSLPESDLASFMITAATRLLDAVADSGAVVDGPFGASFPPLEDDVQSVEAFVPVAAVPLLTSVTRATGVRVTELPATDVAVLMHRGAYDTLLDAYLELGAWVASEADPSDLPVREYYLVSPFDTSDTDELRTEVCWPLYTRKVPAS
jgi:DNA-binding transcriptional MerR regulator/effector-binding domain-containing protein